MWMTSGLGFSLAERKMAVDTMSALRYKPGVSKAIDYRLGICHRSHRMLSSFRYCEAGVSNM